MNDASFTYGKWPSFRPVDQNVTCKRCGESWIDHGIKHGHCPPCDKPNPKASTRPHGSRRSPADYTTCQKTINHKGPCKHA